MHSGDDSCNAFCAARSNRQLAASKRFPNPSRRPKRRILCPQSNGHETSRQGTALPGYGLFCFQIKTLDAHPKANSSSRLPSAHQSDHPARTGRCGNPKQRPERDSRRDRVPNPKRRHTVRRDGPDARRTLGSTRYKRTESAPQVAARIARPFGSGCPFQNQFPARPGTNNAGASTSEKNRQHAGPQRLIKQAVPEHGEIGRPLADICLSRDLVSSG